MKDFHSLVVSGGSVKVLSVIGVVKFLNDNNKLNNIINYVGTSAGSIVCLFLILNYSTDEIVQFILDNCFNGEIMKLDVDEIFNIFTEYGVSSGVNLIEMIKKIIFLKLKVDDITFIDLAKHTGKNLVTCVANITKEQHEFFSVDTQPNMSIVTAIRTSCSIPILFTPVTINDDLYVDGAVFSNFPISYFKEDRLKDILGIYINTPHNKNITNIFEYINLLTSIIINKANNMSMNDDDKNIITIEFKDESNMNLQLDFSKETMKEYIKLGYNLTKKRFE